MTPENTCRICGQPEAVHQIVFWDGVAHTKAYDAKGKPVHCSQTYADHDFYQGQIQALTTVVRSLRMRAGRVRNSGHLWDSSDLIEYSDYLARQIERFRRMLSSWINPRAS